MIKNILLFFLSTSFAVITLSFVQASKETGKKQRIVKTIVVDAGHGIMANGRHNGAKGVYSYEDEICLAISKELVKKFHGELPEIKIIETRPTEKITAIHRRAEITGDY